MFRIDNNAQQREADQIMIPTQNGYVAITAPNIRGRKEKGNSNREKGISTWASSGLKNNLKFGLLLAGMLSVLVLIGYALAGSIGVLIVTMVGGLGFLINRNLPLEQLLQRRTIRPLFQWESPALYSMLGRLAQTAALTKMPMLYLDGRPEINAYTVENREDAGVVLSQGIVDHLSRRELFGVLAHEVAHLKNKDIQIMLFINQIARFTGFMALLGPILLVLNLPLMLLHQAVFPWWLVLLLIVSPTISLLLQVAVSINREFQADLDAAALAGDTVGLASALKKITVQNNFLLSYYAPYLGKMPRLLRTHPDTWQRIKKLELLRQENDQRILRST